MLQRAELEVRLAWAEQKARAAGTIMQEVAHSGKLGIRTKLDKTVVTDADQAINDMLIGAVAQDFPEDGVLGEEASAHPDRDVLWVCDPIDDTRGYTLGMTTAMFSLALVENGQPVVAVMYEPQLDKLFTAVKGAGAFENGHPIHVSGHSLLKDAQIALSPRFEQVIACQKLYSSAVEAGVKLLPMNGEAFRGGMTANGMIDGHFFPGRSAHDVAAVKLIVGEAGGKVTDLHGKDQRYDGKIYGAIVSNGRLHNQMVELLAGFDPENYIGY